MTMLAVPYSSKVWARQEVTSAVRPHLFELAAARLASMRLLWSATDNLPVCTRCRNNPRLASDSVQLPIQDASSPGMTSIHRQPTMTAKLSRKREQSSSNILFESVSTCFSPLSPGTPFPLRQRQAAKTYTSGQAQSWSLPLPRLANPGARSLTRALAMSQDKALF